MGQPNHGLGDFTFFPKKIFLLTTRLISPGATTSSTGLCAFITACMQLYVWVILTPITTGQRMGNLPCAARPQGTPAHHGHAPVLLWCCWRSQGCCAPCRATQALREALGLQCSSWLSIAPSSWKLGFDKRIIAIGSCGYAYRYAVSCTWSS